MIGIILGFIVPFFVVYFIIKDAPKRGMSKAWGWIGVFGLIGLLIYQISKKPLLSETDNTVNSVQISTPSLIIPDTCPHCKNPNNRKTRLCEWCGEQIV